MLTLGEKARRHHEAWLEHAVRCRGLYPEIPVRRVDEGGFDDVRSDPEARQWADSWWRDAFEQVDKHDHERTSKRKRSRR